MVTIKQVSELAGVSSATVSRVINNTDTVKEKTRKQVVDAMEKLGYRHNVIAASRTVHLKFTSILFMFVVFTIGYPG